MAFPAATSVQNDSITAKDFEPDGEESGQETKPKETTPKVTQDSSDDEVRLSLNQAQIDLLLSLAKKCEAEDQDVRFKLLRTSKAYHDYFRGFQDAFWDETAHDWTIPSQADLAAIGSDGEALSRIVNIVRAHGEALISALGSKPPNSKFFPDDADVNEDVVTARAYSKIQKLLLKYNEGSLLLYKTLFILYNEGIAFGYNYTHTHESYGQITKTKTKPGKPSHNHLLECPQCGYNELSQNNEQPLDDTTHGKVCPECGTPLEVTSSEKLETTESYDEEEDKSRECIEIWGLLNVKFPLYAKKQEDGGYLRLAFDENIALTKEKFPEIEDEVNGNAGDQYYERWARTSTQYLGSVPPDLGTVRVFWFRPWLLNLLGSVNEGAKDYNEDLKGLKDKFPKGIKITVISGSVIAEIKEESLDEHWTVTIDPLCNYLHSDPVVAPVIPLQDAENELFALSMETVEQGIVETFADPDVLNFTKYSETQAQPGLVYPATPKSGRSLQDSFYQSKSATLNQEVGNFEERVKQKAEFVLGSLPSIWGGQQTGGSKTLGEYSTSRAQALQRLGIIWQKVSIFFNSIYKKAVPAYAEMLKERGIDEKIVEESGTGFINVWIKHEQLSGKIGDITCESSDALPTTWAQRKDLVLQLFAMNNPVIQAAMGRPENGPAIRDAIGLEEIFIPGEDSRDKQYYEFVELLDNKASQGQDGSTMPSLMPQEWEDHPVEIDACKSFLVSQTGLMNKEVNADGYNNIVAHMNAHQQMLAKQQATQQPVNQPKQVPPQQAPDNINVQPPPQ